ncbi:DUF7661 family protein [Bordetella genomosp. 13]|uniref:DUF7661 domain-containing protein n=1 Tax=Bordetella genomosp. 13 TaxID=463040 RepID=A0A1W6ZG21_9BORD|nr:hypothetical protein [Bordetella genomosp. 13]ARP96306.1 hypothetical protein CAL15_19175 [Bordetella genomosp. 13]
MKFDVYGRFALEVLHTTRGWEVYRLTDGKHVRADDIIIPADMAVGDIAAYLDDLLHEISRPGDRIVEL